MTARLQALNYLDERDVKYHMVEHPAVYTIEEMEGLKLDKIGLIVKNLFLRDAKGKRHFLVLLHQDKKADLKILREKIGSTPLQFASADRLMEHLGLEKGAVSPLGVINDRNQAVEVIFDSDLRGKLLGVHPNDNTATVWLDSQVLEALIKERGNAVTWLQI